MVTSRGETEAENLVDGIVILHYDGGLENTRATEVKKMRRTAGTGRMYSFGITDEGDRNRSP
ncbi:hypothetical protein AKJ57_06850 [candidate division MSBL1 archaeon SCGC-AAA259A05]|uniref:KaiC-like domain-containing protein n=1 Tax=candidate division MSBL1 archaeon SCGC-AAA259A05 TaxID=1698259 RepID=A0A133U2T4_9EURY|nr:hypothetical protein AKJ57_06850 [candidate division MSBL1 archaeon SCGC-AAA259A05]